MDTLKTYGPTIAVLAMIGGGIAYLNVDWKSKAYTSEEFYQNVQDFRSPCDIAHTRYDKDGKPYSAWTFDECVYLLKGVPTKWGDCNKKETKGGSYSYTCSLLK